MFIFFWVLFLHVGVKFEIESLFFALETAVDKTSNNLAVSKVRNELLICSCLLLLILYLFHRKIAHTLRKKRRVLQIQKYFFLCAEGDKAPVQTIVLRLEHHIFFTLCHLLHREQMDSFYMKELFWKLVSILTELIHFGAELGLHYNSSLCLNQ